MRPMGLASRSRPLDLSVGTAAKLMSRHLVKRRTERNFAEVRKKILDGLLKRFTAGLQLDGLKLRK